MSPRSVGVAEPLALRASVTDVPLTVRKRRHIGSVNGDVRAHVRHPLAQGVCERVEAVGKRGLVGAELLRKAVARPDARAASESVLQARMVCEQGRHARPCREAVQGFDEACTDECASAVALPSTWITTRVEPGDQGCYFGGVEKRRDFASVRSTRYFARCHRSYLSCGRAPGDANLAGAYFSLITSRILRGASDGSDA
jgi:hypothetical protein